MVPIIHYFQIIDSEGHHKREMKMLEEEWGRDKY